MNNEECEKVRTYMYQWYEDAKRKSDELLPKLLYPTKNPVYDQKWFELKIQYGGYYAVTLWLYSNRSCRSFEELKKKIMAFQRIVHDDRCILAEKYMEEAYLKELSNDVTSEQFFQKGLDVIKELLSDSTILRNQKKCCFQWPFQKGIDKKWKAKDYYYLFRCNGLCYQHLSSYYKECLDG